MHVDTPNSQHKQRPLLRLLLRILCILVVTLPAWGTCAYACFLKSEYQNCKETLIEVFNKEQGYSETLTDAFCHSESKKDCITLSWRDILNKANIETPYLAPKSRERVLITILVMHNTLNNETEKAKNKSEFIAFMLLSIHQHRLSPGINNTSYTSFAVGDLVGSSGPCEHGQNCSSCTQSQWDLNSLRFKIKKSELLELSSTLEGLSFLMEETAKQVLQSEHYKNTLKVWEKRFTRWTPKSMERFNMFKLDDN